MITPVLIPSLALVGLEAHATFVYADGREEAFHVEGLSEASRRETSIRVRAALAESGGVEPRTGVEPRGGVLVSAPAGCDVHHDVAIAVAVYFSVLISARVRFAEPPPRLSGTLLLGDLSLVGKIHPVRGVYPLVRAAPACGFRRVVVPTACGAEALAAAEGSGTEVFLANDLREVIAYLRGDDELTRASSAPVSVSGSADASVVDLVCGCPVGRRALEIAAAGNHHLALVGEPGSGRVMLARRLVGLLPAPSADALHEFRSLHSVGGLRPASRPFRAPHYTVSDAGLLGGGSPARPGEVSLAHGGVLLLDDLPEFSRTGLAGLVAVLDDGESVVARGGRTVRFPARPQVVAAMSPCPCGRPRRDCACTKERVGAHYARVASVLERCDVQVVLEPASMGSLLWTLGESSATVRERVVRVREIRKERCAPRGMVRDVFDFSAGAESVIRSAVEDMGLSEASRISALRVSRTIADLAGSKTVLMEHAAEAVSYRFSPAPEVGGAR